MAFHDRFLVRVPVAGVSDAAFADLLTLQATAPATAAPVATDELRDALLQREQVAMPADVLAALGDLRAFTASQGITVSDRRWRQLVGLLRSAAHTEGRAAVDTLDLWLVPYVVAAQPAQVPALNDWFVAEVAQAAVHDAPWLTRAVEAFEKQLEIELSMPAEGGDDSAGKLALARAIGGASEGGMLRMVTASLEDAMRRRWSPVHVAARLAQVDEVMARAAEPLPALRNALAALERALDGRVWLPPSLAATLTGNRRRTIGTLEALLARLAQVREGFAALPVDEALPQQTPEPIAIGA
jgi:MoxR-like ATPase